MKFNSVVECVNYIESRKRFRPKTDLENMRKLCALFGNPQEELKFIHITGTNGKGSTSLFITNILMESGLNVGTFVSPYVTCFNERIEYNKEYISNEELLDITNLILSKELLFDNINIMEPSFFEYCTLISFIYFHRKAPDVVVLEVGMGGTLDSTNIVTPILSIITNVAMDHMTTLGNTLEEICLNKLGIVKEGKPLFTLSNERLNHLFNEKTSKLSSPIYYVNKKDIQIKELSLTKTKFNFLDEEYELKMLGKYQTENGALAVLASKYLNDEGYFKITNQNIKDGLYKTLWPGRLEVVSNNPFTILDGAHNIDGITRLREFLEGVKSNYYLKVIFAVSSDKEKNKMIEILEDICDEIIFTKFDYRRSDDENNLFELSNHKNKRSLHSIIEVYKEITNKDVNDNKLIVCCGSLYFISEIRKYYKETLMVI